MQYKIQINRWTPEGVVKIDQEVEGLFIAPGLAIRTDDVGWIIDHVPSGMWLCRWDTQAKAEKCARELAPLADWSKYATNGRDLFEDAENFAKAIAICRRMSV